MSLIERLIAARAEVEALECQVASSTTCAELGCDMRHIGGRNASCDRGRDCSCSVPVYVCTRCGDSDYGDNQEAQDVVRRCAEVSA